MRARMSVGLGERGGYGKVNRKRRMEKKIKELESELANQRARADRLEGSMDALETALTGRSQAFEEGVQLRIDALMEWAGGKVDNLRHQAFDRIYNLENPEPEPVPKRFDRFLAKLRGEDVS